MPAGRPPKVTLDFFVHDTDARRNPKILALSRRFGNDGYATYFRLLESLGEQDGLRLDLSDNLVAEAIADEFKLRDAPHLYGIIQVCVDIKLFDRQLWESDRLVFCPSLFNRYLGRLEARQADAARKRQARESQRLQSRIQEVKGKINCPELSARTILDNGSCPRDNSTEVRDLDLEKDLDLNPDLGTAFSDRGVNFLGQENIQKISDQKLMNKPTAAAPLLADSETSSPHFVLDSSGLILDPRKPANTPIDHIPQSTPEPIEAVSPESCPQETPLTPLVTALDAEDFGGTLKTANSGGLALTPRNPTKDEKGSRKTKPPYSEAFENWWSPHYFFCLMVNVSAGIKAKAYTAWKAKGYNENIPLDFVEGDGIYQAVKKVEFSRNGLAIGVPHGCRYIEHERWREEYDRSRMTTKIETVSKAEQQARERVAAFTERYEARQRAKTQNIAV